ncbi:carbon-nitrogen hydrolase family protein [Leadbetterella byssophila]|uniref:carbon-nitrogen hydrolase family protein n=1 Tax=Leadbetterella byssophila TaxID=316068 RepID=UPI0002EF15EF
MERTYEVRLSPFPWSLSDGLQILQTYSKMAAKKKASILCFPETFLPGSWEKNQIPRI